MDTKKQAQRITATVASVAVYLPVLAGILTAMWYTIPLWYLSWYVVVFMFPLWYWDGAWSPFNNPDTGLINWDLVTPFWIADFLVFIFGLALFLYGLKTMVIAKKEGDVLITTRPYQWVRHPQHLGLILFLLAPVLTPILPWSVRMLYIRPSDILSWSLVAFGLIVRADLEEISISKKFGEEYDEYRSRVSFIIPYCPSLPAIITKGYLEQGKLGRYVLWFAIYWTIMTFILFLFSFVQIDYWM